MEITMQAMRMDDARNGAVGPMLHFAPGDEVFGEGDDADVVFKIVSGIVRTCKFLSNGRRQIYDFYICDDMFGFESGGEHSLSAEAVSECTVICYRRKRLDHLASRDIRLSNQLFSYALHGLKRARDHSQLLGCRSAVGKVATFLIERADCSSDRSVVILEMTRQDIADYLGLTIETVSRSFSQLERDALIEIPTAREIRLKDIPRLRCLNS